MKKLVAIVCVIVMMLTVAVSALANPSITELAAEITEVKTNVELKEEEEIVIVLADPETYENAVVKEAVKKTNSKEESITVKDVAVMLSAVNDDVTFEGILTLESEDGTTKTVDLEKYDFVANFADLGISDGTEVSFDDNGEVVSVTATVAFDALQGADPADLENYLIMLINPTTGEMKFIELDADSFDPETGSLTVSFPFLGAFTLIQKTAE